MKDTLSPVRNTLDLLALLPGHALQGLSNKELAAASGLSPPQVSRYIDVLVTKGLATRLETGRYAPGSRLLGMAVAHADELADASQRLHEIKQRVASVAAQYRPE